MIRAFLLKNIYYMLSYACQALKQSNHKEVAAEEFEQASGLFAAILAKGVVQQLKQGLYREYIAKQETLPVLRGKLDMTEIFRNRIQRKQKLVCKFDELSEDNLYNQILKTAMYYHYKMLLNVCYFVLAGMLQTTDEGEYKMTAFSDEHMARLYEKFILEYYRCHHGYLTEVRAAQIKWDLVGENDEPMIRFLPVMQTDIYPRKDDKILIIDAKYYGKTFQQQFDKYTLHSSNVYQIFTYVKNQDKDNTGNVAGLLLYAKTEEAITLQGNRQGNGKLGRADF